MWAGTFSPSPNLHHSPTDLEELHQNQMILKKEKNYSRKVVGHEGWVLSGEHKRQQQHMGAHHTVYKLGE